MMIKKKWIIMLMTLTTVVFLVACENSRGASKEVLPLSEAFEEFPVWVTVNNDVTRHSTVKELFVFENGEVTLYTGEGNSLHVTLEEIKDMSDKDIIEFAHENGESKSLGIYNLDIRLDELGQNTQSIVLETQDKDIRFEADNKIYPTAIFETTYSGFYTTREYTDATTSYITRVDDSFSGFELDEPDTDKENVTLEGE